VAVQAPGDGRKTQAAEPPTPVTTSDSGSDRPDQGLALLGSFLASVPVPMALVDTDLSMSRANPDMAAALGWATDEISGRSIGEAMPGLAGTITPAVKEAMATSRPVIGVEVSDQGGIEPGTRHWQVSTFPVLDPDGGLLGAGLYMVDVTSDHRAAKDLVDRARPLAALASLGQRALVGRPLPALLEDAVRLVSSTLRVVANVLGVAIQRTSAEDEVRASHARVDLSLRAGGLMSWEWELGTGALRWEGSLPGMDEDRPLASTLEEFLERVHPEDRDHIARDIEQMGSVRDEYHSTFRLLREGQEPRWLEARGQLVKDEDGTAVRLAGVVADVTERRLIEEIKGSLLEGEHRTRIASELAGARLSILAEASSALGDSLEPRATLRVLHDLLLPRLCDALVLYAVEDGEPDEVVLDHIDPAMCGVLAAVREKRLVAGGEGLWSARRAVRTGQSELLDRITDDDLVTAAVDDEQLRLLRELAVNSSICLPLVARGRVVGALSMLRGGDRPTFTPDDLALVEELAARAALAVDNARLFESRSSVARTLQRSLLPAALPAIPGVDVATRYRVAGGEIEIGGDFYDVFEVGGGAWAAVIGDVCGKGTAAAALTGLIRHTVRAAAVREVQPSQILRFTNQVLLDQIDDTRFCTAAVLRIEPTDRGLAMIASCGGHPLPLVVRGDGTVEKVECAGTLVGVVPDPELRDEELHLAPGESIVLYTDGVTEARRGGELFGDGRLRDVLTGQQDLDAFALTDLVESAVEDFQGDAGNDDTAILVVRASPA